MPRPMPALLERLTQRVPALAKLRRLLAGIFLSPERQGLFGVLLITAALGLLNVFMLPQFKAADEPRHVAYSILLADGTWPKVTDPLPMQRLGVTKIMDSGVYVAAANHPPLYYWLVGLPLKIGADRHNLMPGLLVARCITLALGLAALVYVFRLVKLLVPDRPAVPLVVTLFTGIIPTYLNTCGIAYNDSLGVLTTVASMHGAMSVLTLGPTRGRLIATGVWVALAMFTRVSGLFVVGPALLVVFIGMLKHTEGTKLRRLLRATGVCAAMVAGILVTSGWFYYRNYKLYGDITASAALLKLFHRKPNGEPLALLLSAKKWSNMHRALWTRLAGHVSLDTKLMAVVDAVMIAAAALSLKALFHLRSALRPRSLAGGTRTWGFAASVLTFFAVVVPMFVFHARGGNLNMRYLLPVAWVPMLILAAGLASVRSSLPSLVGAASLGLASLFIQELYAQSLFKRGKAVDLGIAAALSQAGSRYPSSWVAALFLVFAFGLVLVLRAVGQLHRRIDEGPEQAGAAGDGAPSAGDEVVSSALAEDVPSAPAEAPAS